MTDESMEIESSILAPRIARALEIANQNGRKVIQITGLPGRDCFIGKRLYLDNGGFMEVLCTNGSGQTGILYQPPAECLSGSYFIEEFPRAELPFGGLL